MSKLIGTLAAIVLTGSIFAVSKDRWFSLLIHLVIDVELLVGDERGQ